MKSHKHTTKSPFQFEKWRSSTFNFPTEALSQTPSRHVWFLEIPFPWLPISHHCLIFQLQDNEKKNILAVQSLRNTIMGSTLMATTSILLCSGLAAVISSTYSVKKPLNDTVYGAHGEFMVALKYVSLLTIFLFSFFCHSLSIRFINQVNILINTPQDPASMVTPHYIYELLERGFILNTVGNRLFYAALPLLLWIFGPVLVFLCSITMVPVLYNLDLTLTCANIGKKKNNGGGSNNNNKDIDGNADFV